MTLNLMKPLEMQARASGITSQGCCFHPLKNGRLQKILRTVHSKALMQYYAVLAK